MKKVKTAIWIIIVLFVAILIQQNQGFFLASQSLVLEPISKYRTPEMKTVFIVFAFFLAGLILGTYFLAVHYLRTKKIVKHFSTEAETKNKQIQSLENELNALRATPQPASAQQANDSDAKTVVIKPDGGPPAQNR
jgi:outer membrane murein-binding lipoprotein Lpp